MALLKVALPDLAESGVSARIRTSKGEACLTQRETEEQGFPVVLQTKAGSLPQS